MENTPNLAKAVIAVMKEVSNIEKNMTVGAGGSSYKGVSDKDVKLTIGKAMAKNGLCIMPIRVAPKVQIDRWEEDVWDNYKKASVIKQKQSVFVEVTTEYLLLHESGESQIIAGFGNGVDSQDKAAGKATTYALKNALLYTFMVPTGEIDDADKTHSDDIPVPQPQPIVHPSLVPGTDKWAKCVIGLAEGKATVDRIKEKNTLSPEHEKQLLREAEIAKQEAKATI
jgi:hypothetical protein